MDFDDFDWKDAAILGGIMGFAEESIREEMASDPIDSDPDPWNFDDIEKEPEMRISLRRQLQMLDPGVREYLLGLLRKQGEYRKVRRKSDGMRNKVVREAKKCQEEERETGRCSEARQQKMMEAFFEYQNGGLEETDYQEYPDLFYFDEVIGDKSELEIDYRKNDEETEENLLIQPIGHIKSKGHIYLEALVKPSDMRRFFRIDHIREHRLPRK